MYMPKKPLSVTLEESNILWLRGRARTGKERSLSEALDSVVTSARQGGYGGEMRSAVGTIDLSPDDPDLATADASLRALFDEWLGAQDAEPGGRKTRRRRRAKAVRRG